MRFLPTFVFVVIAGTSVVAPGLAQQPARGGGRAGDRAEAALKRLMAFDKDGNGELTSEEVTDTRLAPLLERADANQDGVLTQDELKAQLAKETPRGVRGRGAGGPQDGPGGPDGPPEGPGGRGGPPSGGPGGFGSPGAGPGGPPPVGQVLPDFVVDQLQLTDEQRAALAKLQQLVDKRLAKILTAEQKQMLQSRRGGPGGGPPGGRFGGSGGQDGPGNDFGGPGPGRPRRPE